MILEALVKAYNDMNRENMICGKSKEISDEIHRVVIAMMTEEKILSRLEFKIYVKKKKIVLKGLLPSDDVTREIFYVLAGDFHISGHHVSVDVSYNDDITIEFERVEDCLDFCRKHGIRPSLKKLRKKIKKQTQKVIALRDLCQCIVREDQDERD